MAYFADLHLHSPYAYATSKSLTLENLAAWAGLKGLDLLATGDFTHPVWFGELQEKLKPAGEAEGLYQFGGVNFVLGTEVSCVYRQAGSHRRIHILLFAPSLETAAELADALAVYGRLDLDGRPTLGISARDLAELVLGVDSECLVIPAHAWTPWYGLFGSRSGFDSLSECFLDMTPAIRAIETGLSSDPALNWGVDELSDITILSFSDAHSLPKLAREATAFDGPLTFSGLANAIAMNGVAFTVEFYPEEGKYHYDGHRKCGVSRAPDLSDPGFETCPVCRRPLTLGVLHRIKALSRRNAEAHFGEEGFIRSPDGRPPFIRLVPLQELIAQVLGRGVGTRAVQTTYMKVVQELGSELDALISGSFQDLETTAGSAIAEAVLRSRAGEIQVEPGYDGVFGKVSLPNRDSALSPDFQPGLL